MKAQRKFCVPFLVVALLQVAGVRDIYAQNLVPNGSFEEGINCPTQAGNVTLECAEWYASVQNSAGTSPTPDWFHGCSENDGYVPPEVWIGFQEPVDGDGYVGLFAFSTTVSNGREIVAVQLSSPLEIGSVYQVEFSVSNMAEPEIAIETNQIGFNFSTHQYYNYDQFPINQSHFSVEEIIPWSLDWYHVSYQFEADSAYEFLHIGNFYDDQNTLTNFLNDSATRAYYAIDNVSVSHVLNTSENGRSSTVTVYPNPAHSSIQINAQSELREAIISIYSATGNKVFEEYYRDWAPGDQIDVSDFEQGMYCLRIISPQGVYFESFIKN